MVGAHTMGHPASTESDCHRSTRESCGRRMNSRLCTAHPFRPRAEGIIRKLVGALARLTAGRLVMWWLDDCWWDSVMGHVQLVKRLAGSALKIFFSFCHLAPANLPQCCAIGWGRGFGGRSLTNVGLQSIKQQQLVVHRVPMTPNLAALDCRMENCVSEARTHLQSPSTTDCLVFLIRT